MKRMILVVAALPLLTGCQMFSEGGSDLGWIRHAIFGPSAAESVDKAFDHADPDRRREGIISLSGREWGRGPEYAKAYALLTRDPDPSVRAAAVTALGLVGDEQYVPQVVNRLKDSSGLVRLDAVGALGKLHGDQAIEPLRSRAIDDTDADVRVRSATVLRQYKQPEVLQTLMSCLGDVDFGVRLAACQSLEAMTGEECGYDDRAWGRCLAQKDDPFQYPPKPGRRPWWDMLKLTEPTVQ